MRLSKILSRFPRLSRTLVWAIVAAVLLHLFSLYQLELKKRLQFVDKTPQELQVRIIAPEDAETVAPKTKSSVSKNSKKAKTIQAKAPEISPEETPEIPEPDTISEKVAPALEPNKKRKSLDAPPKPERAKPRPLEFDERVDPVRAEVIGSPVATQAAPVAPIARVAPILTKKAVRTLEFKGVDTAAALSPPRPVPTIAKPKAMPRVLAFEGVDSSPPAAEPRKPKPVLEAKAKAAPRVLNFEGVDTPPLSSAPAISQPIPPEVVNNKPLRKVAALPRVLDFDGVDSSPPLPSLPLPSITPTPLPSIKTKTVLEFLGVDAPEPVLSPAPEPVAQVAAAPEQAKKTAKPQAGPKPKVILDFDGVDAPEPPAVKIAIVPPAPQSIPKPAPKATPKPSVTLDFDGVDTPEPPAKVAVKEISRKPPLEFEGVDAGATAIAKPASDRPASEQTAAKAPVKAATVANIDADSIAISRDSKTPQQSRASSQSSKNKNNGQFIKMPTNFSARYFVRIGKRGNATSTSGGIADLNWQTKGKNYNLSLVIPNSMSDDDAPLRRQVSEGILLRRSLRPTRFEESRHGGSRQATHFDYDKNNIIYSNNSPQQALLPGVQDRLSNLIHMAALMPSADAVVISNSVLPVPLAGTDEARITDWTVEALEMLPVNGKMRFSVKVKHLPAHEYDKTIEIWYDREKRIPIRIREIDASGQSIDLLLQRESMGETSK